MSRFLKIDHPKVSVPVGPMWLGGHYLGHHLTRPSQGSCPQLEAIQLVTPLAR
jgi:hypothetical protein